MSFGNTNKTGSGTAYWLLVDSEGRLILSPDSSISGGASADEIVFPTTDYLTNDIWLGSEIEVTVPAGRVIIIDLIRISASPDSGDAGTRRYLIEIDHADIGMIYRTVIGEITESDGQLDITLAPGLQGDYTSQITIQVGEEYNAMPIPANIQLPAGSVIGVRDVGGTYVDDSVNLWVYYHYKTV